MKNEKQQAAAAAAFAERWKGRGYERGESQLFWADLLTNVYGIEDLPSFIRYEERVTSMVDSTNFIDGHIPSTRVIIEQKSIDKDLRAPVPQSEGGKLTPFQQAKKYVANLPLSQHPKWIVTCNFAEFLVYDMEQPNGEPEQIFLKDLGKEYYRLQFLVDARSEHISKEMQVSMKAGEIVGKIYDALLKQYDDNSPEALRWLNILCVRIVFCLYAEDAGVFRHDQFHDYLNSYNAEDLSDALLKLFNVLNTPLEKRSKYMKDDLKAFPYTNGGLFEEEIEIPLFTEELKQILLQNASLDFDWSEISPTIFGAVFESTLNPETRRSGGMHYTSIENIHKVIDPLFLNDLRNELDKILEEKVEKTRMRRLDEYQNKLASLTFLDPACGSGNFLTETYLSLRRLENEVLRERYHGQMMMGEFNNPVKVSIHQFYGIEINDFAVTVATTALWISEAQMLNETERIVQHDIDFLPLKSYANIVEGNALRIDWERLPIIVPEMPTIRTERAYLTQPESSDWMASERYDFPEIKLQAKQIIPGEPQKPESKPIHFDFIMGNPPFVGYAYQSKEQKEDLAAIMKGFGSNIDYVAGWYLKSAQLMRQNPKIRAALVSTNSITQGEQVAAIWKPLFEQYGIHFDFAYRTFRWDSEADIKAHVHCVVLGFSAAPNTKPKTIYLSEGQSIQATNINGYLLDAPDVFIEKRKKPLCKVAEMIKGSQPTDGGHLILSKNEKEELVSKYPQIEPYIHRYVGSDEFINNKFRYCLWLVKANPSVLRVCPPVLERIEQVRQMRLASPKAATQKWADFPTLFTENRQPESGQYLMVPRVSSERRRYLPIGFLNTETVASDACLIVPNASLYHFGVLASTVHMAWMRVVCGRLKSDYRYSNTIVYNNFPWPNPTEKQKAKIEQTAQAILDARAKYLECSLADLYDEAAMPPELRKAHKANDDAVMSAYDFDLTLSENEIVAELFKMYQEMVK